MKSIKNYLKTILTSLAVVFLLASPAGAMPASNFSFVLFPACSDAPGSSICASKDAENNAILGKNGILFRVINILLVIVGIISVIILVIGGIRYTLSGGDPQGTKGAKDTIIYAVVGLVVSMLAFAIVNFVIGNI